MEKSTDKQHQELGEGLLPDAGLSPIEAVTWPRLSVVITAVLGIGVLLWAYLGGAA